MVIGLGLRGFGCFRHKNKNCPSPLLALDTIRPITEDMTIMGGWSSVNRRKKRAGYKMPLTANSRPQALGVAYIG